MTGALATLSGGPRNGQIVTTYGPKFYTREALPPSARNERPRLGLYERNAVSPGVFDWKGWQ